MRSRGSLILPGEPRKSDSYRQKYGNFLLVSERMLLYVGLIQFAVLYRSEGMGYRIGVDIGGTFTDGAMIDSETGEVYIAKASSTLSDPLGGFQEVIRKLAQKASGSKGYDYVAHGTTIATNAIIERKIPSTALITTRGFRDVLEIMRTDRKDLYDVMQDKPLPLIPRKWRFEVRERIDKDGVLLQPVQESEILRVIRSIRREKITNIAICFLHAYKNPANEKQCKKLLTEHYPEARVAISSDILPEFREYERASTTVINAMLVPIMREYLEDLAEYIHQIDSLCRLYIMQSNGGLSSVENISQNIHKTINSGPAAGVIASKHVLGQDTNENLIAIDIGGTSCDISVITRGSITTKTEDEVYGHPIKGLILDIDTIGAGGGSIAWIDSGNVLQVGPMSAGADPGPVSYGRGGSHPTLTDANLILGRLDKDFFLGEEIRLNVDLARKELEDKIAKPLGLGIIEAASGITKIASSNIFEAIRINTIGRGIDPREYSVVAYGGAGPMHMSFIAHDLGCKSVIVPPGPGVFSATGILSAPLMYDFVQTEIVALDRMEPSEIEGIFVDLSRKAKAILEKDGIDRNLVKWERSIDMRYIGQSHEVSVFIPDRAVGENDASLFEEMFNEKYQQIFGYYSKKEPVEMVNLRLVVRSSLMMDRRKERRIEEGRTAPEYEKLQEIFFDEFAGFVQCPVYERKKLEMGCEIDGPVMVRQIDCTTIVPPGDYLTVDSMGNMIIRRKE